MEVAQGLQMEGAFLPVVSQQVLDPEALAEAIRHADFVPCQLSAKPSLSMLSRVVCSKVCLDVASLGPAMLFSGSMPRDCYTLVFVTKCPQKGRSFNFSVVHNDGYMGFFPPGGLLDAYTPEGYTNATLTVPEAVFLAAVQRMFPEIPQSVLKRGAGVRIAEQELSHLRGLLAEVMAGIQDPAGSLANKMARKHLESALLDGFLMALRSACKSEGKPSGQRAEGRLRHLRRARDYLMEHLEQPVQLADLCGELGLSRRGVEMLFRDTLGIGPITFLRHQRLHGVRRALLTVPPRRGTVKKTALEWGFWHMGHFSKEYREFFGESPSTTLSLRTRQ
jgi:AraC-like DNA-binding protein